MARLAVIVFILLLAGGCERSPTPYEWELPYSVPEPVVPADNPMTEEKVALGRALFYDTALSQNQRQSCASCHQQANGFAEPVRQSVGTTGEAVSRNALALVNVAYNGSLTWAHNGLKTIEQQLLIPLFNDDPVELGLSTRNPALLERFNTPRYRAMFEQAFGEPDPSWDYIVKALASFVRSLVSFSSPFDDYAYGGNDAALTDRQLKGMTLFFSERLECFHCHGGVNFTQSSKHAGQQLDLRPFHNTGLYNTDGNGAYPETDQGLYSVSFNPEDMGKFRAPTLRNITVTAPYMHDGSVATLAEVIDIYASGGRDAGRFSPYKSPFVKGFEITDEEKDALIDFLNSLTDQSFLHDARFGPPAD
ncbi:MbnH family di-heme enzyme [Alteromonas sp. CYL-A6]|uniref:MbnH family di-heme enzyme n=1 Tax=Alteromonas nitratireducens TaxID=3390813 RepID=UPI0034B5EBFE